MKQSRRHELRTNELADYLLQLKDWFNVYGNYVLGGLAVVILIIGGASYYSRSQANRIEQNWSEFRTIDRDFSLTAGAMQQSPIIEPAQKEKLRDHFRRMEALANTADDKALSTEAWRWIGDRQFMLSVIYTSGRDVSDALRGAETAYTRATNAAPGRTFDVLAAKFGLAAVYETTGEFEKARTIYEEIAARDDAETTVQQRMASEKLEDFDRLKVPVILAAAPEPPATRPAATQSTTTRPMTTQPTTAQAAMTRPSTKEPTMSKPAATAPAPPKPPASRPVTRPATRPTTKPAG